LFDVVCSIGRNIEEIDPESTAEAIRKLKTEKDTLSRELDALDNISNTMMRYSESLTGEHVSPSEAESFFENLLSSSRDMGSTRAELEERMLELTREIDALSSTQVKKQGKASGEVTVVIMAKQATDIKLRLTYRMSMQPFLLKH
jgi:hypothetical protein